MDDLWAKLMYIPADDRAGILTYVIYKLLIDLHVNRYREFATLLGILDCVSKEF
jgi:hypothetical protein